MLNGHLSYSNLFLWLSIKSGASNRVADALSRRQCLISDMQIRVISFDDFRALYITDAFLAPIYARVTSTLDVDYTIHDGFLFKGISICIPTCILREKIISEIHSSGHVGRYRTLELV